MKLRTQRPQRVAVKHPTRNADYVYDLTPLGEAIGGDRVALARVLTQCAYGISGGYPLPVQFAEFLSARLLAVAQLLPQHDDDGIRLKKLNSAGVQRALLGDLRRGGATRTGTDMHEFLRQNIAMDMAVGHSEKDAKARARKEWNEMFPERKKGRETMDRLARPTPPRSTHGRRKRDGAETK